MKVHKLGNMSAFFAFPLLLMGCVQTSTMSYVQIWSSKVTVDLKKVIREEVYRKAENLGGKCEEINAVEFNHRCIISPSQVLQFGYNAKKDFVITVETTIVHYWWPPTRDAVISGKIVSEQQVKLEDWLISMTPREAVERAGRVYRGYDFEVPILP